MKTNEASHLSFGKKFPFYILLVSVAVFSTGCTLKNPLAPKPTAPILSETSPASGVFPEEPSTTETVSEAPSSLSALLALGKPQKCTWEQTVEGKNVAATIYVNGKSFIQELPMGALGTFYGLSDGVSFYSWSGGSSSGVKMNMAEISKSAEALKVGDTAATGAGVDLNKDYNFKCSNWIVDPSKFIVPENIKFVDIADFTQNMKDALKNLGGAK